jgi:hypothetical protein
MKKKIVAMIPARIGSERLKKKNLALLNKKPLIYYAIHAAKKSKIFKEIYINSDDKVFKKIYDILLEAKATKRCIIFENFNYNHVKNFTDIPAKVALASDITIHDTLLAGTAGLESALCGKKSIFFDYYHSKKSLFLKKELNIVFQDWDVLWEQIMNDSKGISNSNFVNLIKSRSTPRTKGL